MMNEGKRGPNGGVIDIDDPVERFPLRDAVHECFELLLRAADSKPHPVNRAIYLEKAVAKLTGALEGKK